MSIYKIELKQAPWESPMKRLRFKVIKDSRKQLRVVEYSNEMEPHWCEKGHMGYVLEGQMEIQFTHKKVVFYPGDGLLIPSGKDHRHSAKVLSEKAVLIMFEDL